MTSGPASAKAVTRRAVRTARAARVEGTARAVESALARQVGAAVTAAQDRSGTAPDQEVGPGTVAVYTSLPGEPGTGALREELRRRGHPVLLPYLTGDLGLAWVRDPGPTPGGDPLRPAGERLGPQALASCVLVLVPALAVDRTGTRLGQGGGSYDRALVRLRSTARGVPLVLAVVHDDELVAEPLPREPHDVGVDGALTPSGLVLLR